MPGGAAGAKADRSCGIHIHIGLGEHTPQSLRRLVNIVNAKEDLLTMALGITPEHRERWCRPVEQRFLTELNRRKPATMDEFARIWYRQSGGTNSDWRACVRQHYDYSRYHLLNLHATFSTERPAHTIEFRAFNGTLLHQRQAGTFGIPKLVRMLCIVFCSSGCSPGMSLRSRAS